ncbi:1-phosphofructokinase family hexose kinase [Kocuria coralli]|uniref:1-phosphofructokinase family hexose kinase n=1 Tax=Kocuria coralli TaxID=1461025 RepID=A0A5J5KZ77_9MICC|nr:1-phosphofructokinase family hexose kinase [Kocuria coralli]KAA9394215.1 1-phosphofructokinase family hexose kinase [Kocuria coralli]
MIITFTANPSIDRTADLSVALERGGVNRIVSVDDGPGGKGINVSRALVLAGAETSAVFPAPAGDPLVQAVKEANVPFTLVERDVRARTNLTVTEPDGTTTKINEPGSPLDDDAQRACLDALLEAAKPGDWVALCGSLPPGPSEDWYARMVAEFKQAGLQIAVDTSDAPLVALAKHLEDAAPNILKPNGLELGQLVGVDGPAIEAAAENGDFLPAAHAARKLVDRGVTAVLATLGAAGAVLVTADGAWVGNPPPITPVSTVGAGDSSLAGLLLALTQNLDPAECLRHAVAYGSGATALAGTGVPSPDQVDLDRTKITELPLG